MAVIRNRETSFEIHYPIVIIGGGGCGMCAALAARDNGIETLILERDKVPLGSTAMSTGLIPAAGTPEQSARGIEDSPQRFTMDILQKTKGETDHAAVSMLAAESAHTVSWLRERHGVQLSLLDGFLYPGHTAMRMYGMPNRSGGELMAALTEAVASAGADVLTEARVVDLYADDSNRIQGVKISRPDGETEDIGCDALILACSGFGGDTDLVQKYVPQMREAVFHGHPGNKGDAVRWGAQLDAKLADMGAYQGHGGLAVGHGVPILWPLIMEGGFQINIHGVRFSDETLGYSEQAEKILKQPGKVVWSVFDQRLHQLMLSFDDYGDALRAGAIISAETHIELAAKTKIPEDALTATFEDVAKCAAGQKADAFGRDFTRKPALAAPYYAAKVTGALFHTQGGLVVDSSARVVGADDAPLPNLYAGGGAARGVSGSGGDGYIAGNGLLTATTYGKVAGRAAAAAVASEGRV